MRRENFANRHNGVGERDLNTMLQAVNAASLDQLVNETVPQTIRLESVMDLEEGKDEFQYLQELKDIAAKNKIFKSYIGLGYNNCITPAVILRNVFENPGWYTAYTPYQAEISQGRLEALLNFQTMITDLTGMELANASLLDEGTAAGEAMIMFYNARSRDAIKNNVVKFFVADNCFPQTIDILKTRAIPLGIELVIGNFKETRIDGSFFGALVQYPAEDGKIENYSEFVTTAHSLNIAVAVAADLMSLALLTPPGEWGADVVVGSSQRFGVPVGYGGPHAAYFATKEEYKRHIPGRIIGVSVDKKGRKALRMALQTREQHIKRERATSNICTSQVLLANMAGFYAVYHGPNGIKTIAENINTHAAKIAETLKHLGYTVVHDHFFDTIRVQTGPVATTGIIREEALREKVNFRYFEDGSIGISINETTGYHDVEQIISIFAKAAGASPNGKGNTGNYSIPAQLKRTSSYLTHDVFNRFHSETEMMRYVKRLENRDISLVHSMIPLGSCTMKLNAATEMMPVSWPEFSKLHPFVPVDQAEGYQQIFRELEEALCEMTGFKGVSLQPNSGAQGEYAGLMVIREYLIDKGESHRNIVLIPSSAHGTNPASGVMAGMDVVIVKCDENGNIDINDLREKAIKHQDNLAAMMVTYPSTHGVFEEGIKEATEIIHQNGGQVYMDGANMNAQVGLTNPANIGADVCHLNLHKTFAIPHGGGGPGMGPIAVAEHLVPYLPGNPVVKTGGEKAMTAVSAAPWGSASILLISYAYIKLLGRKGLTEATQFAILNANYIKSKLEQHYPVLYSGKNGRVAHELILDCREFKKTAGVEVEDIAKRLIDYGFHAPTVSFPVPGTIMIEPTESESLEELDRFCEAMVFIRNEIEEIAKGEQDRENNVLKNSPHTAEDIVSENWLHPYSREKAVYPVSWLRNRKFWPAVNRIDNAYGDRNLFCTCPSVESFEENLVNT